MTTNCYSAVRRRPASTAPCALSSTRSRSVSFFSRSRRSHRKRSISLFELSRLDDFTPFSLRRFFSRRRSRSSFASASRARFDARPLVSRRSASSSSRSARTRDGNVDRGFTSSSSPIARAYHGALAFLRPPKRVPLCSASRSRASRFASLPPPVSPPSLLERTDSRVRRTPSTRPPISRVPPRRERRAPSNAPSERRFLAREVPLQRSLAPTPRPFRRARAVSPRTRSSSCAVRCLNRRGRP